MKFVAHHLWNRAKREAQRKHGMPRNVAESLREDRLLHSEGPRTRRRRSGGSCRAGHPAPRARDRGAFASPALRPALRLAVQASVRPRHRKRRRAVTRDVLHRLLATCASDCLADTRDVAILIVAFPSGGRRARRRGCVSSSFAKSRLCRSIEPSSAESRRDVGALEPFPNASTGGPTRNVLPSSSAAAVLVRPSWIARHGEAAGVPGDRPVGAVADRALTPQSINLIVKATLRDGGPRSAGLFGASVEGGVLTEAARRGIALQ